MPFVDRTPPKRPPIPTDIKKLFVGRANELNYFVENVLKSEKPTHNIISIWGQGGVGKSTLLARFINEAQATNFKDYCLTAIVDERQTTSVHIMEKIADQLQITGAFEKALEQYKETLRRLRSEQEAAQNVTLHKTADILSSVAKEIPIPVVNLLVEKGTEAATEYLLDKLHYHQLVKDARRLEDPVGDLTKVFVNELNALVDTQVIISADRTKRSRRIILFFDTFEQLAATCAPWLLDNFLEADVSNNVVLVIAGRDPLEYSTPDDPKRWLTYRDDNTIYSISLDSFTLEETRKYLAERGIIEQDRIEAIWHLSHGLPLYLGLLTSNPHGQVDPTANVVANFLRWIPEQEQIKRRLALDASFFSRSFNQDELGAFIYISKQERSNFFQWLITQPFVRSNLQDGRYSYHELAQELFNRHLYQLSPSQCHSTREALVNYYQGLLMSIEASQGKDVYSSPEWLELTLALVYQLLLLPDEASHIRAVEKFFDAGEYVDDTGEFIKTLRKLQQEIIFKRVSGDAQQIIKHSLQILELIENAKEIGKEEVAQKFFEPVNYFLERGNHTSSFSLKVLALLYDLRGSNYFALKQYEQAIADYTHAIELDPGADHFNGRGNAYRSLKQYEQAIADYTRAIELDPSAGRFNRRGNVYYDLEEYEQAIADYTRAIELDLKHAAYYSYRGTTYSDLKEYEQAIADFTRAIELDPEHAAYYSYRGYAYRKFKHYEQAIADYTRAIELDPSAGRFNRRGNVYYDLEEYEQAIADYTRAIELEPEDAVYYSNRGDAYHDLKQYEQAIADYSHVIELDPEDADYFSYRGDVYRDLEDYERAIADYSRAIELAPEDAFRYYRRGKFYRGLEDYERAIADYSRAIELAPEDIFYYSNRGGLYHELEDYERAIVDYSRAIALDPEEAFRYNRRANVYVDLKDYERAIADYSRAIELAPEDAFRYNRRANVYVDLKDYERAIADYSRAIELAPEDAFRYYRRGNLYCDLEDYERAIADYSRAIELAPDDADYYGYRGSVYINLKDFGRALTDFNRAIEIDSKSAVAFAGRGLAYLWLKDIKQAVTDLRYSWELKNPTKVDIFWIAEWAAFCLESSDADLIKRLEEMIALETDDLAMHLYRGVIFYLSKRFDEALSELQTVIERAVAPKDWSAYFWKGMVLIALERDKEAIISINKSLELKLPPALLAPLRRFEKDRQAFYEKYIVSLINL